MVLRKLLGFFDDEESDDLGVAADADNLPKNWV